VAGAVLRSPVVAAQPHAAGDVGIQPTQAVDDRVVMRPLLRTAVQSFSPAAGRPMGSSLRTLAVGRSAEDATAVLVHLTTASTDAASATATTTTTAAATTTTTAILARSQTSDCSRLSDCRANKTCGETKSCTEGQGG
jgi:hypothetical protein